MGNKAKEVKFLKLVIAAHEAGLLASQQCKPTPMIVQQHANPLDDNSAVKKTWFVEGGVCGFAWVKIKPATSSFARWAKKNLPLCGKDYYGGLSISSPLRTQSMERNESYCSAYAKVLSQAGIRAYMQSRID